MPVELLWIFSTTPSSSVSKMFPINLIQCVSMNFPQPWHDFAVPPLCQDTGFSLEIATDCSRAKCKDAVCGSHTPVELLCPCGFCPGVETTQGCQGKPIKKCHQAPLSLSQQLGLEGSASEKKMHFVSSTNAHNHLRSYFCPKRNSNPVLYTDMKGYQNSQLDWSPFLKILFAPSTHMLFTHLYMQGWKDFMAV